jgi:hypothetical protein
VVQRLGSVVECVLTPVLVVCFASCSNPGPQAEPFANSGRFTCCTKQNRLAYPIGRGDPSSQSRAGCVPLLACNRSPFGRPRFRFD